MSTTKQSGVKPIRRIMSAILAIISAFALVVSIIGLNQTKQIMDYLNETDTAAAIRDINTLKDGIGQIQDNEDAYFSGAKEYDSGLKDYQDGQVQLVQGRKDLIKGQSDYDTGKKQLADAKKQYADGKAQLDDGARQIAQGEKDLAEGKKQVADGQKELDANTQAYNEGKEQLAQIEPLMPYVDQYVQFRDGNLKSLPGFDNAQSWFTSVVRPVAKQAGLDIPDDVNDLPGYVQNMVKDGKAQLKQYEDGQKQLEEGKKQVAEGEAQLADAKKQYAEGKAQLDDGARQIAQGEKDLAAGKVQLDQGYADYADGQKQLADGAVQLKQGKADLKEFEDGVAQIKAGLQQVLAENPVFSYNKHVLRVKSPSYIYGKDCNFEKLGKDGKPVMMHNDQTYIDTEKSMDVANATLQYIQDSTDDATAEMISKFASYFVLALAALLGLIAGLMGFKGRGSVLATIAAVLGVGDLIYGIITHFFDFAYTMRDGTYAGNLQSVTIIIFAVLALCAACIYWPTRVKREKKSKKKKGKDDAAVAE